MIGAMDTSDDLRPLCAELKVLLVKKLRLRDVAPESIDDDAPLIKGPLGLDSIDILELALAVEKKYDVKISDEQLGQEAFQTVAALARFVRTHAPSAKPVVDA
jgi:acyl carrier protein